MREFYIGLLFGIAIGYFAGLCFYWWLEDHRKDTVTDEIQELGVLEAKREEAKKTLK